MNTADTRFRFARGPAIAALAITLLACGVSAAQASTLTSTFTQSNVFPSGMIQDWGSLGISCNGTSCSVNLTPNGDTFFGQHFMAFNLNGGASNIQLSNAIIGNGGTLSAGSFNLDGFGTFANLISLPDGPNTGYASVVDLFTVDYTGTASTLLTLNDRGFDAAGHVLFANTSCTGYVGEGTGTNGGTDDSCGSVPPPTVPEPTSLLLLGTAIGGFGFRRLKRRS